MSPPNDQPPPSSRTSIRTSDPSKSLSRDQILSANMGTVKTAHTAKQALVRQKYFPDQGSITLEKLPLILLQISAASKIPAPEVESMRAVALVMEELLRERSAEELVNAVISRLNPSLLALQDSGKMMVASSEEVRDSTTSLANTVEEHRVDCQNITHEITTAAHAVEASTKQMDVTLEQALKEFPALFNYKDPVPFKPANDPNIHRPYIDPNSNLSPNNSPPSTHAAAVARYEEKAKQVLIVAAEGENSLGLDGMDPHELTEKANLALDKVTELLSADEPPPDSKILGAQLHRSGDLLLHLSSKETATWLLTEDVRREFIMHFSSRAEFKDRQYQVIAEFVPTNFSPDSLFELIEIETVNKLPFSSIISARWIKPIAARKKDQKVAHAILGFRTPEAANATIRSGLFVKGKRVAPRKLLPDPKRCFKCHKFDANHLAKDCKQIHEWCDICGEMNHDNRNCPNKDDDPQTFFCISCNTKGHSTRNRACPTFRNEYARLTSKVIDSQYRFFVTEDASSWEMLDPFLAPKEVSTQPQAERQDKRPPPTKERPAPPPATKRGANRTGTNTLPLGNNRTSSSRQTNLDNYLSQGQNSIDYDDHLLQPRAQARSWADDYEFEHPDSTP